MTDPAIPTGLCIDGKSHIWTRRIGPDGFPIACHCQRGCGATAPEPFCRTPQSCHVAGRCLAEVCCNE